MGRGGGKVTLKQIQNEKVRKSSFIQRKKGLTKKVSDFSKNFGVDACLIVYDGDGDGKPMIWPQDFPTLQSVLTKYEQQKIETIPKKFDAKDYFANKKNMVEAEILNVRKKIVMNKYPTWGKCFNNLKKEQLRGFIDIVDRKIQACTQRISMLKNKQQSDQTSFMQNTDQMQIVAPENIASPQSSQLDDLDITKMIDFSDLMEWDEIMAQKNVFSSHSSQLDVMQHSIPQMQDDVHAPLKTLDNISLPPVSPTSQLKEFLKLDDPADKSDQDWGTYLMNLDAWAANELNDGDGWVKQPYAFECQDIFFLSEIKQQCTTLDAFSQPIFEI